MDDRPPGTDDAPPGTSKPARASAIDFFDAAPAPSAPAPSAPAPADQAAPTAVPPPPPPPPPPAEPALPPGWTAHADEKTGATYYWNAGTGATSWDVPTESSTNGSNPSHAAFLAKQTKTPSSAYIQTLLGDAPTTGRTDWVKHTDINSGVPYFSNTKTNATTWDPPAEGFVDATTTAVSQAAADPYAASATFNRATGRFEYANGGNYWDAKGIPQDREGRMMSHYFDLDSLEQNRAEAAAKKQKLKHKKYDWRKYKAAKKKEKVKRQVQKLLED
jgi:hypothetical protein